MAKYLFGGRRPFKKITSPRKKGISWWRHIFTGLSSASGDTASLFVEYVVINPSLSPDSVLRASKIAKDPAQIGSLSPARPKHPKPSHIVTRASLFSSDGIIFENFLPASQLKHKKSKKGETALMFSECVLGDSAIAGTIEQNSVIYSLFSDSTRKDAFSWNIAAKETALMNTVIAYNKFTWKCSVSKTLIKGAVQINEETYNFTEPSFCYFDKLSAKEIPSYWFSISGAHIMSKITNQRLEASCFVVQGFSPDEANIFLALERIHLVFKPHRIFKQKNPTSCSKNEETIHWTVSAQNRQYVLDIDIYCRAENMKLRNYDSPAGNGIILSLLTGAAGSGEIRLYKRLKKSLELIEHAEVENALCEFGGEDSLDLDS
jgi:hypothetical protein